MQKLGALLLVLATVPGIGLRAQAPAESRTFLLFLDDLHVEFQHGPRVRELTRRLVRDLTRNGDRWAIVTTGASSVSVAPTPDPAAMESALRRITGNGLTARKFLDARQQADGAREIRHRATVALSTAVAAIAGVSVAENRRPFAVLYISNGYDAGLIETSGLIQTAVAANARVYTLDPRGWSSAADHPGVSQADWEVYLEATRIALTTLASRTQGAAVLTEGDLGTALARLAQGRR